MDREKLKELYESIKSDNLRLFTSLMLSKSDLNISFGRFPILSLCYLFKAEAILNVYEPYLTPISKFEIVPEYFEIYREFKKHAKRSLRIFADKQCAVYPIEMLAILDERKVIANKYKFLFKNEEILNNLQKIYNLNQEIEIKATKENFECKPRKLSLNQKIISGVLAIVLCVLSVLSFVSVSIINRTFGKGTKDSPIYISNEAEFLTALKKDDKYYVLDNDIVLSKEVSVSEFSGTLDGADFTVFIKENSASAIIEKLSGTIQNLNIEFASKNMNFGSNYSILTQNNAGTIKNCSFFGEINGVINSAEDAYVSVAAYENNGTIENVNVSLNANISNQGQTNAYLSAVAGKNNKTISNAQTVSGKVITDTVDLAGIAAENYGEISNTTNGIELVQTSSKEWHPNCAGISMINYGTISACKNYGAISAESTREEKAEDGSDDFNVIVGGISCENYYMIENCRNIANLSSVGDLAYAIVGGIVAINAADEYYGLVRDSKSTNKLTAKSKQNAVYAGGVVAQNQGQVLESGFEGTIAAHSDINDSNTIVVYAGGVIGFNRYTMQSCYADVTFENPTANNKDDGGNEIVTFIYGGLTGCANVVYAASHNGNNNHYVNNSTINSSGYWFIVNIFTGNLERLSKVTTDSANYIVHDTIDEIPEEVRIYE